MYQLFAVAAEGDGARGNGRGHAAAWSAAAAALWGVVACSPALEWRQVRPPDWSLGFSLPCRPEQHERQVPLAGAEVPMRMVSCTADGHLFAVTSADLADPQRVGPALQALAEAAQANAQARVLSQTPARVRGMTPNPNARQFTLQGRHADGAPLRLRVLVFAHGARVFQASVVGQASDDSRMNPVFDSLELTP